MRKKERTITIKFLNDVGSVTAQRMAEAFESGDHQLFLALMNELEKTASLSRTLSEEASRR